MSGKFKMTTLGEISKVVTRGKTPQYDENGLAFIVKSAQVQIQKILWERCPNVSNDFANKHKSKFALQEGDVLLNGTGTGTLGRPGFVDENPEEIFIPDSHVNLIRVNQEVAFPKYVFYWLLTPTCKGYIEQGSTGSTNQIELSADRVSKIKIPLPPLEEQKRIAQVLDKADRLRQKDRQLLAHYDQLLQSVFLDMFGDPVKNEKGWERGTIREVITEAKYGTSKPAESEGEYPYLRMNNLTYSGAMDYTDLKYINLEEKEKDKYLVRKGDLLFNRTNSKELVGKTAVYRADSEMAIAGYLIRVRTNEKANTDYISGYLNSRHGKETLRGMCKSIVGMANINAQELQDIKVLIPPVALQNKYSSIVKKVEEMKFTVVKSIETSETLFQSLLQKAFKGELALKEVKAVEEVQPVKPKFIISSIL